MIIIFSRSADNNVSRNWNKLPLYDVDKSLLNEIKIQFVIFLLFVGMYAWTIIVKLINDNARLSALWSCNEHV